MFSLSCKLTFLLSSGKNFFRYPSTQNHNIMCLLSALTLLTPSSIDFFKLSSYIVTMQEEIDHFSFGYCLLRSLNMSSGYVGKLSMILRCLTSNTWSQSFLSNYDKLSYPWSSLTVVLESPVQSGFLAQKKKTETETRPDISWNQKDRTRTEKDRDCGLFRSFSVFGPVLV